MCLCAAPHFLSMWSCMHLTSCCAAPHFWSMCLYTRVTICATCAATACRSPVSTPVLVSSISNLRIKRVHVQLLEYDHYERFSAKQALAHRWLAKSNPVTTPLARARTSVVGALDRAIAQLFDTKAFMSMRDSLSEAELYSALNEDKEPEAPARGTSQTVAWWQERSVRAVLLRSRLTLHRAAA